MTTLALHYHPLSSYCQKVLIALDELGIEAEKRLLNLGDPAERSALLALWPLGKMPLLVDQERPIPETSIVIVHLQRHHAGPGRVLIPNDPDAALEVRLWDRLFDLYVMTPMQAFTADLLRPDAERDPLGVARAPGVLLRSSGRAPLGRARHRRGAALVQVLPGAQRPVAPILHAGEQLIGARSQRFGGTNPGMPGNSAPACLAICSCNCTNMLRDCSM